tara:strand:- start:4113 stop:4406 length:294 start_codon:yes stop_codon:yes gene_type:complete
MSRAKAKSKAKAYQKSKKKGAMKGITVKSGGKLSVAQGGGLSAKGRKEINRKTGSNLKAPAPNPKTKKDAARRKSFCARSRSWKSERGLAARKRWNC